MTVWQSSAIAPCAPPLVSVVIPCHNSARYLTESVESVLAQTYPAIEIIAVDDGSTDDTRRVAESLPVEYIYQPNRGVSAARNNGVRHSRGKYVLFLDYDDRLLPRAVEIGVKLLEEHPECAMAVGEHRYIAENGTPLGSSHKQASNRNHYQMLLQHNFVETPCSALHRRSSLVATGLFDESLHGGEDHELYLRIARQGPLIAHEKEVSEYRLHKASSSRNSEGMLDDACRVLEMELQYLDGDREKLRAWRKGIRFMQRHYGRRLTREIMALSSIMEPESRRKLDLLRRHYALGFAIVLVSRLLPPKLVHRLLSTRTRTVIQPAPVQSYQGLSLG
jgi:glycosyltransferase involved in cell wall biosynthesis